MAAAARHFGRWKKTRQGLHTPNLIGNGILIGAG